MHTLSTEVTGEQFGVDLKWPAEIYTGSLLEIFFTELCAQDVCVQANIIKARHEEITHLSSLFLLFLNLSEGSVSRSQLNFGTFERLIPQSCFLIALFNLNQDLRRDSALLQSQHLSFLMP